MNLGTDLPGQRFGFFRILVCSGDKTDGRMSCSQLRAQAAAAARADDGQTQCLAFDDVLPRYGAGG